VDAKATVLLPLVSMPEKVIGAACAEVMDAAAMAPSRPAVRIDVMGNSSLKQKGYEQFTYQERFPFRIIAMPVLIRDASHDV
jgi:hypothetical protein